MENDVDEQKLINQIKALQDELTQKNEENYIIVSNLKEENQRLIKQV